MGVPRIWILTGLQNCTNFYIVSLIKVLLLMPSWGGPHGSSQNLDSDRSRELYDFLYSFSYKSATFGALVGGITRDPPESGSDRSPELYDFL